MVKSIEYDSSGVIIYKIEFDENLKKCYTFFKNGKLKEKKIILNETIKKQSFYNKDGSVKNDK